MKKNKIIISIALTLLLITTVIPVTSFSINENKKYEQSYFIIQKDPKLPPLPGFMKSDELDIIANYLTHDRTSNIKTIQYVNNEEIVSLIQQIDEDLYLGFLENLTSFGPRVTDTQACEDAGEYIYNEFQEMGLDTRYQEWSNGNLYSNNVEATLPGINETSDEIYIICAHYDSVPGSPGADDDGSGVAAVLSAAKIMSQSSFNHTIRFVTFSGEEQGLYGSLYYVEEAYNNNENIIAALNADMIGFAENEDDASKINVYEDDNSEWLAEFTRDVSQEYNEYLELEVILSGYTWGSDHYRFWEAGYHAIFYAEYNFNDYYHSPEDTIEHMDISYATRASKLIIATLAELSEITKSNAPPLKPAAPEGINSGRIDEEYTYTASTIDPDEDELFYQFDWGNGEFSEWIGPYNSDDIAEATYTWTEKGDYEIRVKAKDDHDVQSEWSDPLVVSMPKNKAINTMLLFLQFLENHPLLFPLLRQIMRL